jgi:hypothetical protein
MHRAHLFRQPIFKMTKAWTIGLSGVAGDRAYEEHEAGGLQGCDWGSLVQLGTVGDNWCRSGCLGLTGTPEGWKSFLLSRPEHVSTSTWTLLRVVVCSLLGAVVISGRASIAVFPDDDTPWVETSCFRVPWPAVS